MPTTKPADLLAPLKAFCRDLTDKVQAKAEGDLEDQLKPPVDALLKAFGELSGHPIVPKGESKQQGIGRPDFVVVVDGLPLGFIELKAPGKGADPEKFSGHDQRQWESYKALPNLIYTDGTEWALFRGGEPIGRPVVLFGKAHAKGAKAAEEADAIALFDLLQRFTRWAPVVPSAPKGLAEALAPYCGNLRDEVVAALKRHADPVTRVKDTISRLLFPDATDTEFADAYAQTVTFALLLARVEGADTLDLAATRKALGQGHGLLASSLQFLTDESVADELSVPLGLLQRVTAAVRPDALQKEREASGSPDPWLYFYEDFLAAYDPAMRKNAGAYYTPVEVVRAQVRLIEEVLKEELGLPKGYLAHGVKVLDPAAGTGTYLLNVVDQAMAGVSDSDGAGLAYHVVGSLAPRLFGFEKMVGPYAVAQLRLAQKLAAAAGEALPNPPAVYLTDTLESPYAPPPSFGFFEETLAEEHKKALTVKHDERVVVVLGNPPYLRTGKESGGWVSLGDPGDANGPKKKNPIFEDFLAPASAAGFGGDLKNAYNLYVFFLRWALWKAFEHGEAASGPGVVSFITPSSYLTGGAFAGVRAHMRKLCDRIDIIDLGGEGKGTRRDDNVFDIQVPVCVCIARRVADGDPETPAVVSYTKVEGTRTEKLKALDGITVRGDAAWEKAPSGWLDPLVPKVTGVFARWPKITSLFPWQQGGVKAGRTWVIAPNEDALRKRVQILASAGAAERIELFKNSPTGQKVDGTPFPLPPGGARHTSVASIGQPEADAVPICRYAYRSFDRQQVLADARFLDRAGPSLWQAHGPRQLYLSSLFSQGLGEGPALTVAPYVPDLDHFRGSYGGAHQMPLYRDAAATEPNLLPGLLDHLEDEHGERATPEDVAGYAYAVLAQPAYTARFHEELAGREVRLPLTRDGDLFRRVAAAGRRLIALHTRGERCAADAAEVGDSGIRNTEPITAPPEDFEYDTASRTLRVGDGRFAGVKPEVWVFSVSGLEVVRSWLNYRLASPGGRKSSPLDRVLPEAWTLEQSQELLGLLRLLDATVSGYPAQALLLNEVLASDLIAADDLPDVPTEARKAPAVPRGDQQFELRGGE